MGKLTQKNINNIIYRHKRGESIVKLSKIYGVSRKRIHQILADFTRTGMIPTLHTPDRKKRLLSQNLKQIILDSYAESGLGVTLLEAYIEKNYELHIPHNRIHEVLISEKIAEENPKKKKQRKYCRYQCEHSMTLWHTDWKEFRQDGENRHVTAFIDDRSRFIVSYGVFDSPTTENTLIVLEEGITAYGCPEQIVTDNGSQYVTMRGNDKSKHKSAQFLAEHEIKHIRSRISHPQTNGKIERFFGEIDRRFEMMGSIETIVHWQNYIKPHRSLGYDIPADVFWHALKPERILEYVNCWFWR